MNLFLHIGTEKTGSTTIQNELYLNEDVLRQSGVSLLKSLNYPNNTKLGAYLLFKSGIEDSYFEDCRITTQALKEKHFENFIEELSSELKLLKDSGVESVIISNEHLHSRIIDEALIKQLHDILSPYFESIRVVCYFRDQAKIIPSFYSTYLKNGYPKKYKDFVTQCFSKTHYFDYYFFISKWANVFGKENLILKIYNRNELFKKDIFLDFMNTIGKSNLDFQDKPWNFENNRALGPFGIATCRSINNLIPRKTSSGKRNLINKYLIKVISRLAISSIGNAKLDNQQTEIRQFFKSSNDLLAKEFLDNKQLY
jgi:hypothetical protein